MATESVPKHEHKNSHSSYKSDNGNKSGSLHHLAYKTPQYSSTSAGPGGTPGSGSLPFNTQSRPKLMMRASHVSTYFSHEGLIHLSGEDNTKADNNVKFNPKMTANTLEPIESEVYRGPRTNNSSGLLYNVRAKKEIASIDAIHDNQTHAVVCAGKSHLGYYRFSPEDNSIVCTYDVVKSYNSQYNSIQSKRGRPIKFSTIADVKTGFQQYSNYVAICSNSTNISLYDISRRQNYDSAVISSLSEHTRSINGFDFNMIQTHLMLSGGQDGCIKIWDLRSNSAQKRSSGCDININTTFGSIRDTKWMPGYNFASFNDKFTQEMRSHNGYKFASIHDSGAILKFDMRQPHQPERKINAHSGPGLCINWHPHKDYIVSGGRDGKCSLWYFGDKSGGDSSGIPSSQSYNPHQGVFPNSNTNSNLAVVYPETTINVGSPITKLKFRPSYDKNVYNSMLAVSCMGDEARVSIHSLGRRYIPKHVLETSAPAIGLVWWDSDVVFNIDKNNFINGWDISKEPTVLENLSPITAAWRDIDGYGFTYINQDVGSYKSTQDIGKMASTGKRERPLRKDSPQTAPNTTPSSGIMNKLGMSHMNMTTDKLPPKLNHTYSSKSLLSTNSYKSGSTTSLKSGMSSNSTEKSPYIITLDLPYIFNGMRHKQLARMQKEVLDPTANIFKETPVEMFKYLVRELDFSLGNEKKESDSKVSSDHDSTKTEDEKEKEDLMKKFGFTENATWTALVNKTADEKDSINDDKKFTTDTLDRNSSKETIESTDISEVESHISSTLHQNKKEAEISKLSEALQKPRINRKHRIKLLLKLVGTVNHNATVYSDIGDLPNFKIWILIRDSLLWDLKKMDVLDENDMIEDMNSKNLSKESFLDNDTHLAPVSDESLYSSRIVSSGGESTSLLEEHPQALDEENEAAAKQHISILQKQLKANKDILRKESQEGPNLKESDIVSSEAGNEMTSPSKTMDKSIRSQSEGEKINDEGIPILRNRKDRLSFIDTFMTERRPMGGFSDANTSNRYSLSAINSSPQSKLSSIHSLTSGYMHGPFMNKMLSHMNSPKGPNNLSSVNNFLEDPSILSSSDEDLLDSRFISHSSRNKNVALPPWNTRTFIQQLYKKAVESGNTLLGVNILLLFHNIYDIVPEEVVKNSLAEFVTILHRFETFEIAAALLKHCPWDDIMGEETGHSSAIQIYCDRCQKPLINELSKENFTRERNQKCGKGKLKTSVEEEEEASKNGDDPMKRFGYWYCDNCKKPNSLCVFCERPMKKLTIGLLSCGHEGHFDCYQQWFLDENMDMCPAGCNIELNL